ncbi:MAG: prepilin peptidase [Longimicrobiales bacterium]|nr:prepilin peptidase [Longimicrobiales bacterium]
MTENEMIPVLAGVLGLVLGSFLNVCSLRWPRYESVVSPPSRCPSCGRRIRWHENVPVLGWLLLRGRCRGCGESISVQYPLVELATGLIWAGMAWQHGPGWEGLRGALFLTLLLGIAVSDARFYIIPDQFSVGGAALGLLLSFAPGGLEPAQSALGALVWVVGLWLVGRAGTLYIRLTRPERFEEMGVDSALGFGDVKMMGLVGAFTGVWGGALTVFLGSVVAVVVFGVIRRLTDKLIPFGIFLAVGAAVAYVRGEAILAWYLARVLGSG